MLGVSDMTSFLKVETRRLALTLDPAKTSRQTANLAPARRCKSAYSSNGLSNRARHASARSALATLVAGINVAAPPGVIPPLPIRRCIGILPVIGIAPIFVSVVVVVVGAGLVLKPGLSVTVVVSADAARQSQPRCHDHSSADQGPNIHRSRAAAAFGLDAVFLLQHANLPERGDDYSSLDREPRRDAQLAH
jgi:hypothetical protein